MFFVCCSTANKNTNSLSSDFVPFLKKYFSTWSNNNMKEYRSCFHKDATITYLKHGDVVWHLSVDPFMKKQSNYLSRSGEVSEKMVSFVADEDKQAATATIQWVFKKQGKTHTGVDRFSLMRDKTNKWKIIALVWYQN